jgi:hypothetical protein
VLFRIAPQTGMSTCGQPADYWLTRTSPHLRS